MNVSAFASLGKVYSSYDHVQGIGFKMAPAWEKCALLPVICAMTRPLGAKCARFDRVECLLPPGNAL